MLSLYEIKKARVCPGLFIFWEVTKRILLHQEQLLHNSHRRSE
jgi:hypothetical protein